MTAVPSPRPASRPDVVVVLTASPPGEAGLERPPVRGLLPPRRPRRIQVGLARRLGEVGHVVPPSRKVARVGPLPPPSNGALGVVRVVGPKPPPSVLGHNEAVTLSPPPRPQRLRLPWAARRPATRAPGLAAPFVAKADAGPDPHSQVTSRPATAAPDAGRGPVPRPYTTGLP